MWTFIGRLLTLATGMAAGILVVYALDRGRVSAPSAPATAGAPPIQAGERAAAAAGVRPDATPVADGHPEDPGQPGTVGQTRIPSGLPDVYRGFVEPRRQGPTTREMHAMFQAEPRDEPWAGRLESGINDYVATYAAAHGLVVEYVECRSRFCEVAGYAIRGYEPDFSALWAAMSHEPWWDAGGGLAAQYDGEAVSQRRFIAILPRHDEDERAGR